jgi:hypothetical protein
VNRILLVITSQSLVKKRRIYYGTVEWCDGWRFAASEAIALRKRNDKEIRYLKELTDLSGESKSEDSIIWIRGEGLSQFPRTDFNLAIKALLLDCEVSIAYHDEFIRDEGIINQENVEQLKLFVKYTLEDKPITAKRFEFILADQNREKFLDPQADFDKILYSFFIDPSSILSSVQHGIIGRLSVIDTDLQTLWENHFEEELWTAVVQAHRGGYSSECIRNGKRLVYSDDMSLKRLYEKKRKLLPPEQIVTLDKSWQELSKLLPESGEQGGEMEEASPQHDGLYSTVLEVISGLESGKQDKVKKNFQEPKRFGNGLFRKWLEELGRVIDCIV